MHGISLSPKRVRHRLGDRKAERYLRIEGATGPRIDGEGADFVVPEVVFATEVDCEIEREREGVSDTDRGREFWERTSTYHTC